ncbi:hypothetical protein CLAFUW4_08779 [Fulvia fulva]|uniref:Uncharacterized protein n=1 Tax=Passalora fulva TaxID=5499 RepID=A0A9Q8PGA8_PASFU|nr:uncharacterized protein CLAFUR5_08896 [Fulvia fulva]KAK4613560.1 hypothetical protein CLAFUR4_08785 [Fulvia fulva]KAK4614540.1 hypothetical protein CLAFUR0_08777 [Fulvia fulva]UJO21877.1 hypothetical protein CLAFUR5_08896 [Fulvia fulva]WPV20661.1 hypothetical protein CLAFUW4_08779 [Fulvia fulva]WPV34921.1 hypothetical protein CLAFUW7_08780 [Fulvia fulva]
MPFPFFNLPQELRDEVYERLISEAQYPNHPRHPFQDVDMAIRGALVLKLLLVSRRFAQEYQQCQKSHGVLMIDAIKVRSRPASKDIVYSAETPPNGNWVRAKDHFGLKLIGDWRRGDGWKAV